jgi:hypothetical protein
MLSILNKRLQKRLREPALGLFYLRYMDDIVVLAPGHWKLRQAVRVVNLTLNGLRLEKTSRENVYR